MRTTVTLPDDLMHQVRTLAERQGQSLSMAISTLLRRGLEAEAPVVEEDGIPMFKRRPGQPTTTLAALQEAALEE